MTIDEQELSHAIARSDPDDLVRRLMAYLVHLDDEIDEALAHAMILQTFEEVIVHHSHDHLWDGTKSVFVVLCLAVRKKLFVMPEESKQNAYSLHDEQ